MFPTLRAAGRRSRGEAGQIRPGAAATALVSAWCGSPPAIPAARFVTTEIAATGMPRKRARIVSGTVDMPTRSAPRIPAMRTSAGVSKLGPENHA
ncbi:hypothetical protein BK022_23040 [Methylorubrum extorquens]|uniref:Uncharacterized protein n=1 Tax=Methylorubrum extorquens TaxID=408 RepID=A0A1S1P1F7_METEX|nr:hypothetical protein BK022_23040 [Methylorubrum extorquens]